MEEISREVTLKARENGIEQLFLTQPMLFSKLLLEGRLQQYHEADICDSNFVFLDRGMPDVLAYMDYFGSEYPENFTKTCQNNIYDMVFILAPWKEIFKSDSVRYETFDQSLLIHDHLLKVYENFNYHLINIPFDTVQKRTDYIMESLNL